MPTPHAQQIRHHIAIATFFGGLWFGLLGTWLGWGQSSCADEKRVLAPPPRFDRTFPEGLGLYLRDRFGGRGWLISVNAWLRVTALKTSTSRSVILGRDGFLFFGGEGATENFKGADPMKPNELDAWVALFERRARLFSERGIAFKVTVAPNKESIYPEMMPLTQGAGKSRLNLFIDALRARTSIEVIDLRPALRQHKVEHLTYYRTDSHWTQWGAYWAYREILPSIDPAAASVGVTEGRAYQTLDLAKLLGLDTPEAVETFAPQRFSRLTGGQDDPVMTSEGPAGPRLVFLRDSFGAALMPFLGTHFARVYAPNGIAFNLAQVLDKKPDVVLVELVERRLNAPAPVDQISPAN